MHVIPILSSLRRHKTAVTLIVLEIALTCAIVINAVFLVRDRLIRMDRPSGLVEDEVVRVQLTGIGNKTDPEAVTAQDLAALATLPGVKSVAVTNMVPFGRSSWNSSVSSIPRDPSPPINIALYMGSPDLIETWGARITAGRDFLPEEYVRFDDAQTGKASPRSVIVTRAVAERLFPNQDPLGKQLYTGDDEGATIVGVIEELARPNEIGGGLERDYAMVRPVNVPYTLGGNYLLRVDPAQRGAVLATVDQTLDKIDPSRILLDRDLFPDIRKHYFKQDRAMAYLLVGISIALLVITALGVVGLASFWVQQRTRQIGVRRALGATRGDILRYFQIENFILATLGIIIGMGIAFAINLWLMQKYAVPRLPWEYLPIGASLLWLLGQVAVLGPALRAAAIPPATATRSV
jgi:putative ABC transport system permease protein